MSMCGTLGVSCCLGPIPLHPQMLSPGTPATAVEASTLREVYRPHQAVGRHYLVQAARVAEEVRLARLDNHLMRCSSSHALAW